MMLVISNEDIAIQTERVEEHYAESSAAPLLFDKFISTTLTKRYEDDDASYPKEIKIPKSLDKLLKGDSSPERIIKLDKPLMYEGEGEYTFPIWRGDSTKGVNLVGLGYKNGDSRYPSNYKLDDTTIHKILGGMTGHGKSVTLNSIAYGIKLEYGPWEVKVTMVDAKVVEFKKYAKDHVMPHIGSIAATTDADYIISVLQELKREMMLVNSMFTVHGVSNIIDFRKKTGLAFPQNVIIMDEFQTMFKNAERRAKEILDLLDDFARLGRSTGYHLLLCSQEVGDMPDATLNNIGVRGALGCQPRVSEKLLGNDEGKVNLNTKGRLIININPANNDKKDNVHFRVPFQTNKMFESQKKFLTELGEKIGFRHPFSFYDEDKLMEEDEFQKFVIERSSGAKKIYLGEPSFVMRDPEGDNYVKVNFTGEDIENMIVFASNSTSIERYVKMLKANAVAMGSEAFHNIFAADKSMVNKCDLSSIGKVINFTEATSPIFKGYVDSMYMRKLCMEADDRVFDESPTFTKESDEVFYHIWQDDESKDDYDSELNRSRFYYMASMLSSETYLKAFDLMSLSKTDLVEEQYRLLKSAIMYFKFSNAGEERLTYSHMKPVFNWVIGCEKVLGWERDFKNAHVERLKKVLQDCSSVNIRFILTTVSMDNINGIKSGVRYCVLDGLNYNQAKKVDCEEYPQTVGPKLGVFFDRYSDTKEAVKFKKMAFTDEIFA